MNGLNVESKLSFTNNFKMKVGSRDSELAMKQTNLIVDNLKSLYENLTCEIDSMKTIGDKNLDVALSKIGSKSLFTKELELVLENCSVDIVVHSLKDLPTTLPDGLVIGAITKREDPRDAVVVHPKFKGLLLKSLPKGSVIGTSSLRRTAQLGRYYPHLKFESIRGNLNTRLKKLDEDNKYSAIILAAAGIIRMGWGDRITQYLDSDECMYAVGQGALAIECRESDLDTIALLAPLMHVETLFKVSAERAVMKTLEGGCSVPLAVDCKIDESNLMTLKVGVWSLDGQKELLDSMTVQLEAYLEEISKLSEVENILESNSTSEGPPKKKQKTKVKVFTGIVAPSCIVDNVSKCNDLGVDLANKLIEKGARDILLEAKAANMPLLPAPVKADVISNSH